MDTDSANVLEKEWVYHNLVFSTFEPKKNWVSLAYDDQYIYPLAHEFFWHDYVPQIRAEILRWQELGWEPAEHISPASLKLRHREYIDCSISVIDVVMWIATFGLALLVTLLLGDYSRRYIIFEPIEFSVLMRRQTAQPETGSLFQSARLYSHRLPQEREGRSMGQYVT